MSLDIEAYFQRIEYAGSRSPTLETLKGLHLAHATHIPFENLDVMLHRPVNIDLESIEAKLVHGRRGGYCYEQNLLFASVLEALEFNVSLLQARVRFGTHHVIPRTHVLLDVDFAGDHWIADLGFGSRGLIEPVPLAAGEYSQFVWMYRIAREGEAWVLRAPVGGVWQDLYTFTCEPQLRVDFIPGNHYVSTHPDSRFVQTLTVQSVGREIRRVLKNLDLVTTTAVGDTHRRIASPAELLDVLAEHFGLKFPPGTAFFPAKIWL